MDAQQTVSLDEYIQRLTRAGRNGWVTTSLMVTNISIFVLATMVSEGTFLYDSAARRWFGSLNAIDVASGEWWRLVTATFLHGGLVHLAQNMLALWYFGRAAEYEFGSVRFAAIYLVSGAGGSYLSMTMHPGVPSMGASGAILGVIAALLGAALRPDSDMPRDLIRLQRLLAMFYVLVNVAPGLSGSGDRHTDYAAHAGGAVSGFVLGFALMSKVPVSHVQANHRARIWETLVIMAFVLGSTGFIFFGQRRDAVAAPDGDGVSEAKGMRETATADFHPKGDSSPPWQRWSANGLLLVQEQLKMQRAVEDLALRCEHPVRARNACLGESASALNPSFEEIERTMEKVDKGYWRGDVGLTSACRVWLEKIRGTIPVLEGGVVLGDKALAVRAHQQLADARALIPDQRQ